MDIFSVRSIYTVTLWAEATFSVWAVVRIQSSLCWQLFKSIQKCEWISKKTGFFLGLTGLECCARFASQIRVVTILLILWNLCHLMADLTINFACESRNEFCTCTIENWMVVGRGYFSHASSHSENVASAHRELHCTMYSECTCIASS